MTNKASTIPASHSDPAVRYVDDPKALGAIFKAWHQEFGNREISVCDLKGTTTGRLLLATWSSERMQWRLRWLRDLVSNGLKLVRVGPNRYTMKEIR